MWCVVKKVFKRNTSQTLKQRCIFLLTNLPIATTNGRNKAMITKVILASFYKKVYIQIFVKILIIILTVLVF